MKAANDAKLAAEHAALPDLATGAFPRLLTSVPDHRERQGVLGAQFFFAVLSDFSE